MSLTISMKFALDQNRNGRIEKEEWVGIAGLKGQDRDGDDSLKGRELEGVFFEYGADQWLPADRTSHLEKDGWISTVRMNSIGLSGKIDLSVNMHH